MEEQFYFLFPLVILLLVKRGTWLLRLTLLALLVSFALSVYTSYHHEWASYYLLPSRAWQMMMGALLAIMSVNVSLSRRMANSLGVLAILLIVVPAIYYTKQTRFPGVAALAPTFGAALVIFVGGIATTHWVGRFLSSRVMTFVGVISYSLYLWHWPIFAFLRNYQADVRLGLSLSLVGIVVSVVMAYLSWRYVEAPFRNKVRFTRRSIFCLAVGSSTLLLVLCVTIIVLQGMPSRIDPKIIRLSAVSESGVIDNPCMKKEAQDIEAGQYCVVGDAALDYEPSIALWGDSHLGALKQSLSSSLAEAHQQGLFFGKTGCPPLLGVLKSNTGDGEQCARFNDAVFQAIIRTPSIDTVVIHARWALSIEGTRYAPEKGPRYILKDMSRLGDALTNAEVVRAGA